MNHKGYVGKIVEVDEDTGLLHGRVLGIRDVVTFEGRTVEEARAAFLDSVDDYLAFCTEMGQSPDKPYSGTFNVRLAPQVHRDVSIAAEVSGKSLNAWVADVLEEAARRSA